MAYEYESMAEWKGYLLHGKLNWTDQNYIIVQSLYHIWYYIGITKLWRQDIVCIVK